MSSTISTVFTRNWQLFALVAISQLADFATFLMGISRVGIGAEQNVLVRNLYVAFGPAGPLLLKGFAFLVVISLVALVASRSRERAMGPTALAVGIALFGVWGNIAHGIIR